MRGIIPKKIFRGKENLGFVVGTIVFALLHQPSNLPSLLIYGGMSIVLSWTAYKTQRLEMSILLHMIVNGGCFLFVGSRGDFESDIRDICLRFLTIAYLFLLGKDEMQSCPSFSFYGKNREII